MSEMAHYGREPSDRISVRVNGRSGVVRMSPQQPVAYSRIYLWTTHPILPISDQLQPHGWVRRSHMHMLREGSEIKWDILKLILPVCRGTFLFLWPKMFLYMQSLFNSKKHLLRDVST